LAHRKPKRKPKTKPRKPAVNKIVYGPPPEIIAKVREIFLERERKKREFTDRYGFVRPPQGIVMGDRVMGIVGNIIYQQTREGGYNVVNMIHDYALSFFGEPRLEAEERMPLEQRHPALQWMYTYVENSEREPEERKRAIGAGAAWLRFAYDLFTIADNSTLQATLKEKLLDPKTFQAARHELRAAAICAVAGFDLQYEDESDNSRKHPEFVGKDRFSPAQIAVEAKSRHRRGVQGFAGGSNLKPGERVDVRGMVLEAYKKEPALPLYVFIDVNLPDSGEEDGRRWMHEIDVTMSELAAEGHADPCPANAIFFCNDPSHYAMNEEVGGEHAQLWIKQYTPKNPRVAHPTSNMTARLMKAYTQRISPPEHFPEQQ
jgi:hypothetical protein